MPIIQSIDRALRILDLFDERQQELKISEISAQLSLNKSTIHSLLKTLKQHDYIKQDLDTGKYSLGLKLVERGNYVLHSLDIRNVAKQPLTKLSDTTGQTVHLVILDGNAGVYIDKVEGAASIVFSRIGRRVPIHSSAVGKVLTAFKKETELQAIVKEYDFFKQTVHTITSKEAFLQELKAVVKVGYAMDQEENEPGVCCIAVPIFDHKGDTSAAISISTTISNVTEEYKTSTIKQLKETALEISNKLGYTSSFYS
ncbi:IclR family transcriptional regulator [Aquibacillus koreensis]|uniref:Glycerol operon regulatory protein n=1 Tax=Aquibacillus koreensis TaxID=279446 RepID=A0A9X3WS02_9BACI|nr:IclR family transcriptional regulator [Aquibacillus koreensis]MCT2537007.1 IclR family transcriptional regulator [Aquibacillus koreensis]MDC3422339.1 IclR family transcriptional regulator [Aquibacillus koreensis]